MESVSQSVTAVAALEMCLFSWHSVPPFVVQFYSVSTTELNQSLGSVRNPSWARGSSRSWCRRENTLWPNCVEV